MLGVSSTIKPSSAIFSEIVHPSDRSTTTDIWQRSMAGLRHYEIEYRIIRPDDHATRWLSSKGSIEIDETGKPWRLYGVAQDITERIAAERERADLRRRLMQAQEDEPAAPGA